MNPETQGDSSVNSRTHKRTTARESPSSTRRGGSMMIRKKLKVQVQTHNQWSIRNYK